MELQAAKSEGTLLGLAYLDTARGISGIVQKLPFGLQEKWMSLGYAYKTQYKIAFPPFSVLVDFICQQAKMRNDPSFFFPTADNTKPERHTFKTANRAPISVHKTEVSPDVSPTDDMQKTKIDPTKLCLIHKKPHPLHKCRVFREKSLEDRKTFLKQNGVCFRCVGSTTHQAKNCEKRVQCTECNSEQHHSALHPGPAKEPSKASTPPEESGREDKIDMPTDAVSSRCT